MFIREGTPLRMERLESRVLLDAGWFGAEVADEAIVNRPPGLAEIPDMQVSEGQSLTFAVCGADPDCDLLTYTAANLPEGATFAMDSDVSYTTWADNYGRSDATWEEGDFNADTNVDGADYCLWADLCGLGGAMPVFSWTPADGQAGAYDVTFHVTDGELFDSQTVRIAVMPGAEGHAPVLDAIGDIQVGEGQTVEFAVSATDADGDALTYAAEGLPAGAAFESQWVDSQALTLAAWFRADDFDVHDARILSKSTGTAEQDHYWMLSTLDVGGAVRLRFRLKTDGITDTLIAGAGDLTPGEWVHAAATYDGSLMRLYLKGELVGSTPKTGNVSLDESVPVWIGNNPSGDRPFDGTIDEVQVWNRALSADEVDLLGQSGLEAVSASGLLAYWSFDDGAQTATDVSGNEHTGTISGADYAAGWTGTGLVYDGVDDYVDVGTFDVEGTEGAASFHWTPGYDQAGEYHLRFSVSDGVHTDYEEVVITVTNTNGAPVLEPIGSQSVTLGQTLGFTLSAGDPDQDPLSYSASNLPAGAVFEAGTGEFTWTPTAEQVGTYPGVRFEVTDGELTDWEEILIVVRSGAVPGDAPVTEGGANALYIDRDGDGYGVASPLGPDADDGDADVHSYASAIAKHGSLENFLHYLGYSPERILSGPVAVESLLPGDVVIYEAGTYSSTYALSCQYLAGTAEKPIVFLAKPGERVVLEGSTVSIKVKHSSHLIFDGFVLEHGSGSSEAGLSTNFNDHITYRNLEVMHHYRGWFGMQDLHDILMEDSVVHDNLGSHGIYLGARDLPNSNITIRDCLVYRSGYNGIQHNGRIANFVIENNILHSNTNSGVSLVNGAHDSVIRGNLIFNNDSPGIVFHHGDSLPAYDQVNNVIEDNVIWVGRTGWRGDTQEPSGHATVKLNDSTAAQIASMDGTVIRNNILMTYRGPIVARSSSRFLGGVTIENNLVFRTDGPSEVLTVESLVYDFAAFEAISSLIHDNTYEDPGFADVSVEYYATPEAFDFHRS